MSTTTIRAERLSKKYEIGALQQQHDTLRDQLVDWAKRAARRERAAERAAREFWALRDVSFDAQAGEVIGIVGRNGAGKSTLLKILSQITEPTSGKATIYGHVASLLEVGTGFHPELTGRENVYLNGALLGMKRPDINRNFDAIVAFAEIDQLIDTPVKRYSSGMYVRLAFAVAAHLQSDILFVDEVLAVGDLAFQKKCLGKVGEVVREGRTVLFVSHNMAPVLDLCTKGLLIDRGRVELFADAETVVKKYLAGVAAAGATATLDAPAATHPVVLKHASVCDAENNPATMVDFRFPFFLRVAFEVTSPVPELSVWIRLVNEYGVNVLFSWAVLQEACGPGRYVVEASIAQELLTPGRYYLDIGAERHRIEVYHQALACLAFDIANTTSEFEGTNSADWGVILPRLDWQRRVQPVTDESKIARLATA